MTTISSLHLARSPKDHPILPTVFTRSMGDKQIRRITHRASRSDSNSAKMSLTRTGPLTFRMMDRDVSSMNSTRTWVTPPREPVRPRTCWCVDGLGDQGRERFEDIGGNRQGERYGRNVNTSASCSRSRCTAPSPSTTITITITTTRREAADSRCNPWKSSTPHSIQLDQSIIRRPTRSCHK